MIDKHYSQVQSLLGPIGLTYETKVVTYLGRVPTDMRRIPTGFVVLLFLGKPRRKRAVKQEQTKADDS